MSGLVLGRSSCKHPVVVVGAGIAGCSVAYHLSVLCRRKVVSATTCILFTAFSFVLVVSSQCRRCFPTNGHRVSSTSYPLRSIAKCLLRGHVDDITPSLQQVVLEQGALFNTGTLRCTPFEHSGLHPARHRAHTSTAVEQTRCRPLTRADMPLSQTSDFETAPYITKHARW